MKMAIIMSVLGTAACLLANQTRAQGFITFCNYSFNSPSNPGQLVTAPVTYQGPSFGGYTDGETIGQPFTADLVYSLDGGANYVDAGITTSFLFPSGTPVASGGGLFGNLANYVQIPGYTSGQVDFIVLVYNGASYGASTMIARSEVAVASQLATPNNMLPVGDLFDSRMTTPLAPFAIAAIPEPTMLAVGGLGLLALLARARRKRV